MGVLSGALPPEEAGAVPGLESSADGGELWRVAETGGDWWSGNVKCWLKRNNVCFNATWCEYKHEKYTMYIKCIQFVHLQSIYDCI